jgi:hypothetical protein
MCVGGAAAFGGRAPMLLMIFKADILFFSALKRAHASGDKRATKDTQLLHTTQKLSKSHFDSLERTLWTQAKTS